MRIVGLTGGMGAGKSSAARHLLARGVPVLDCDQIARSVVEPGTAAFKAIVEAFGSQVLGMDRRIDRAQLAKMVFPDGEDTEGVRRQRMVLNRITHPAIKRSVVARIIDLWLKASPLVVVDAPLLQESGLHRFLADVIVIDCPESVRVQRICEREGCTEKEARGRVALGSREATMRIATIIIDNSRSLKQMHDELDLVLARVSPRAWHTWFWLMAPPFVALTLAWVMAMALYRR